MLVCWNRLPSLYNMATQSLVNWSHFDISCLDGLPGHVKEDLLKLALCRGKAQEHVSCFLHSAIRDLFINGSNTSSKDLQNISRCREIRLLEMNPPPLQRFDHPTLALEQLFSGLRQLVRLHLQRNNGMTDSVVHTLATHCPALQELCLAGCNKITDQSAYSLSTLHYLRAVDLSQSLISDEGLQALANGACATALSELTLNSCLSISDDGLKSLLFSCKRLSILVTGGCPKVSGDIQLQLVENKMKQMTWTIQF